MFDPFTRQYAEEALDLTGCCDGLRVLDIAAGTGSLALAAAQRGAEVVATDFSPGMTERLRARLEREGFTKIHAEVMDGQWLTLADDSFDRAYSVFGLIFFPERARGFAEMRRVLKAGGRGAVVAWSAPERMTVAPYFRRALVTALPDFKPPSPPSWQQLQHPEVLEAEMRQAGFRQVAVHTVTKAWRTPSPEWMWENLSGMSPVISVLLERLDSDQLLAVRQVFIAALREKFGDGPVELTGEAHIGVGDK